MQSKYIYQCKGVKENGIVCGNPLYAEQGNKIIIKRHGRVIMVGKEQKFEITCERCGNVTRVGE